MRHGHPERWLLYDSRKHDPPTILNAILNFRPLIFPIDVFQFCYFQFIIKSTIQIQD